MTLETNNEYSTAQLYTVETKMYNPGEKEIKSLIKERNNLNNQRNTKGTSSLSRL